MTTAHEWDHSGRPSGQGGVRYPAEVVRDAIREHWHGTICQLARESGVTGKTIAGILNGTSWKAGGRRYVPGPRRHVTLDTADRIFMALGQWLP